jgi:hypothetical protein
MQFCPYGAVLARRMLFPYAEQKGGAGPRMMKTAFAYWDDRIAPVFDIALSKTTEKRL